MAQNTRELRRRIKATKSIRQITKAMEMIAASKMRKAQLAALASRPYADLAWEILSSLYGKDKSLSEEQVGSYIKFLGSYTENENQTKQLIILITSNRGLCGSLNSQLVNEALNLAKSDKNNYSFVAVGRKGLRSLLRQGFNVLASFDSFENQPDFNAIRPIAKIVMDKFLASEVSRVIVVYADFISTLQYKIRSKQLLPLTPYNVVLSGGVKLDINTKDSERNNKTEILFEPSPEEILSSLLPRLIELQVYQSIVENLASEHSARMVNMKNASDSARDIINDLTLTYNSLRQASITADLADIIGGRMAVK
ncbi:MAG: ATP synthase F1 subunit gamma [Candidatus Terrybacteria bacterium RIFCSPLOWO2_01_FULL_44_24]|uniref:ATP synthase gamma chain n=1 Tax=Candidatus Terrybacteria bacterium RIFCSPHIGHO2_01_FULL_43_35 TaxID=1802361 RepID=A0A1G2PDN0_9BACT|nr:MAG: ATP synthase F1 subunit gamma [Candidatus Terrybacteria bacterium RIFCSPHIGHO2_01_FULL_43_35]OHA49778.1 MAG: ATP synthase F1 subunit gamma [Candidatus Terrybacteria bacterium RIFCSPHIGHO2_02_FULL_43_14]OHA51600.1 MAG: ATP synthase F1 subunit gamma [Candidatus Terrybacteria bacterium RIFCSPLOWO2_01_FULL_44_24]